MVSFFLQVPIGKLRHTEWPTLSQGCQSFLGVGLAFVCVYVCVCVGARAILPRATASDRTSHNYNAVSMLFPHLFLNSQMDKAICHYF